MKPKSHRCGGIRPRMMWKYAFINEFLDFVPETGTSTTRRQSASSAMLSRVSLRRSRNLELTASSHREADTLLNTSNVSDVAESSSLTETSQNNTLRNALDILGPPTQSTKICI